MRTIVDIPEEQLIPLDKLCKEEGISRAEAIREAVGKLLVEKTSPAKDRDAILERTFGMWKDRDDIGDAVEYQRKLRAEWDREWDSERGCWVYPSDNAGA
jgi:metal-responsive CopG/Arc/MetJ family transcriptional regulator